MADDEGTDGTAGGGSPGFSRNTVTLPPIDAHKQNNPVNNPGKRRTDSEESFFARRLDNMLFLPGGANAEHLQTPKVEKRSRLVGGGDLNIIFLGKLYILVTLINSKIRNNW